PGAQIYNNDLNNFAPVVGLAWDIPGLGTKKTVLRAGYSTAYERLSLRLLDVVAGDAPGLRQVADFRAA
ncbi:MAG TPA: hypothetical protein DEH78_31855, partial [Solibacterales bacterium]|nr:hypothetical protein [Bryobacterales bacterium]